MAPNILGPYLIYTCYSYQPEHSLLFPAWFIQKLSDSHLTHNSMLHLNVVSDNARCMLRVTCKGIREN